LENDHPNDILGTIFNIQRFNIHDGFGIRTLIFLKGCPLKCFWCSNPEGINSNIEIAYSMNSCISCEECLKICPVDAISKEKQNRILRNKCVFCEKCVEACPTGALELIGKRMTINEVLKEIEKDSPFYKMSGGGITVTGGEPLTQWKFVRALLKKVKNRNVNTAIETSGYVKWEHFEEIIPYIDLILYDVKLIDSERHEKYCGVKNETILRNLKKLDSLGQPPIIIRNIIVPGYTDTKKEIDGKIDLLKTLKSIVRIDLIPYHRFGITKYRKLGIEDNQNKLNPPKDKSLLNILREFEYAGLPAQIGG